MTPKYQMHHKGKLTPVVRDDVSDIPDKVITYHCLKSLVLAYSCLTRLCRQNNVVTCNDFNDVC